jgi:hypothetical protein
MILNRATFHHTTWIHTTRGTCLKLVSGSAAAQNDRNCITESVCLWLLQQNHRLKQMLKSRFGIITHPLVNWRDLNDGAAWGH